MQWLNKTLMVSPIYYGLCTSQQEFDKVCKKLTGNTQGPFVGEGNGASTWSFENEEGQESNIVCIDPKEYKGYTKEEIYPLLVHEGVHVWQHIQLYIGEEKCSTEMEAYSVQNICQNLFNSYVKQTTKKKKNVAR